MKPIDLSKFRKSVTKSLDNISFGFNDPTTFVSTGNYTLNYLISGDFKKGIPMGKVSMLAGESGCLPAYARITVRFNNTVSEISVGELYALWTNNSINVIRTLDNGSMEIQKNCEYDIEIDTPDGWQLITSWYNKGQKEMVTIETKNNSISSSVDHLFEIRRFSEIEWVFAGNIKVGDYILTRDGFEEIERIRYIEDKEECYDFTVDHPNHRYWSNNFSSHNSGKSFICSGNIARNAQEQGIFVVLIDTENALDQKWLENLGVDTSEDKLLRISMAMIDDVAKIISEFVKEYKSDYGHLPKEERQKVLFIIDSLGMLMTNTDVNQFESGDLKGDMGRKPKALNALVKNCVNMFGDLDIGMVCTNHTYASQNMFSPDAVISGGVGFVFASSIVVAMEKLKLKEDEHGNKTSEVSGIRAKCKVMKTRYNKPFEEVEIKIPWDRGMDPYSGLFDLCLKTGFLTREGNSYIFTKTDGTVVKQLRKNYTNELYEDMMEAFPIWEMNNQKKKEKELQHLENEEDDTTDNENLMDD